MLLKRIKYHNFRPFIGDQEILLDVVVLSIVLRKFLQTS